MRMPGGRPGALLAVTAGCLMLATPAGGSGVGSAIGPGWTFSGLRVSYDTPPFPDTRYRVTQTFSGEVCGNPLGQWRVTHVETGGPSGDGPPLTGIVDFRVENPAEVTSTSWLGENNEELGKITFFLRLTTGATPTLTPSWQTTGDIQNVVATPTVAPAMAQTIPECPAAQPPPPPPPPPSAVPTGTASGTVLVNGRPYTSGRPIPFGSKVNVTD
jgi:hypothetical protein